MTVGDEGLRRGLNQLKRLRFYFTFLSFITTMLVMIFLFKISELFDGFAPSWRSVLLVSALASIFIAGKTYVYYSRLLTQIKN